ncbi:hypothetical protein GCM10020331_069070 [Ectobacillus funiculus]
MIAIIDYGMGNLRSVSKALEHIGVTCEITDNPETIRQSDGIVLPGVGAFPKAMKELEERGLISLIKEQAASGKPVLGICLGMQLLFEASEEIEFTEGLGLLPGTVRKLPVGRKNSAHGLERVRDEARVTIIARSYRKSICILCPLLLCRYSK